MKFPLAFVVLAACTTKNVPCADNSNCDLMPSGVCSVGWCSYPDNGCPSGYRYSLEQVDNSIAGHCVAIDASGSDGGGVIVGGVAASCVDLPSTCGVNSNDTCCHVLAVPAGQYYRSFDASADGGSGSQTAPATISTFLLDKYEVTVGRFRRFIALGTGSQMAPPNMGDGAHVKIGGSGWQPAWNQHLEATTASLAAGLKCDAMATWTDAPGANEHLPINCLTWYEAFAFCAWDGGYLPTEAEWNYAAAGGDQQRVYAWSSPPGSTDLSANNASYNCLADNVTGCALTDLLKVGSLPAGDGRWGHSDLTGNVSEWTLDVFAPYASQCNDCATIDGSNDLRVGRGGSYATDPVLVRTVAKLRTGYRNFAIPTTRISSFGVRCARPL